MTGWFKFFLRATPWYLKPFLMHTLPFWAPRARRTWPYAGAWTQRLGRQVVIGMKPPRLLKTSDRSIGARMFVEEKDMTVKMRHLVCHELTDACAAYLALPAWLNEGIAMTSVDRFLGKQTIRPDTLDHLRDRPPRCVPPTYRQLSRMNADDLALHTVRGYWLVNLLAAVDPGFLKQVFSNPGSINTIDIAMASLLKIPQDRLWQEIDQRILAQFSSR